MASHRNVVVLGLGVLLLGASGCGSDGHGGSVAGVGPSPVTAGAPAGTIRLVVTNGWTSAPMRQTLQAIRDNRWNVLPIIQFEYRVPEGSTRPAEIRKCLAYCKAALQG